MKKAFKDFLDLDLYTKLNKIGGSKCTEIYLVQKIKSPSPKYIFKTFILNGNTSQIQKTVLETFYQINFPKYQYLLCYHHYSFLSLDKKLNPTFSMKYISSITLKDRLQNPNFKNNWTKVNALNCIFAVAEAIGYLHDHIIYHGNLCPSNIIVDEAEQCYVCDFGLYRIKSLLKTIELSNPEYRAPEMINSEPTEKGDVFSFGVLMCQLCLIFFSRDPQESISNFLIKNDKRKFEIFPSFLSKLIPQCLSTKPEDRPSFIKIRNHFHSKEFQYESAKISEIYDRFLNTKYVFNLAKRNDSFALNKLGNMYEEGKGVERDHSKAIEFYKKAAELGNSEAQCNYGVMLQEENDERKKTEGAQYLHKSALQGNIHGMANYGIALKYGDGVAENQEEANKYLKKAADLGYSYAQVNYGYGLIDSDPTPDQIREGVKYIKMAIDQGDPDGYYTYGVLLKLGDVIEKNEEMSVQYFKIAADMGYEKAIVEYANSCYEGKGCQQNKNAALQYYRMAYEKGNMELKPLIDELSKNEVKIESHEISNKPKRNRIKTKKTSSSANTTIHLQLQPIQHFDKNTSSDTLLSIFKRLKNEFKKLQETEKKIKLNSKDISHYRIIKYEDEFVKTNDSRIIYKYGKLYSKIGGTKANKEKAMNYYKLSADLGYSKAQAEYGISLQNGRDIKKNAKTAAYYLERAANQGNLKAMNYYGLALFNGEGIKQNKEVGLKYLKMAADNNYPIAQLNYGDCVNNPKVGHQYIEMAAKAKYGKAILYYARDFMKGLGVEKDLKRAAEILRELYKKENSIEALINLIKCLKDVDRRESVKYLKVLADQDGQDDPNYMNYIHKAQLSYGINLFFGEDVQKDEETAIKYIVKSTLVSKIRNKYPEIFMRIPHDFTSVMSNVDSFLKRNNGVINKDEEKLIKSAYKGNVDDTLQVAKMIEKSGDYRTANFFYEIAADSNQREANFILGKYYIEGKNGLQTNVTKGINYINKASELGYPEARYEVVLSQIREIKKNTMDDQSFTEIFNEISSIAADNFVPAIVLKAKFLAKKGNFTEAKQELRSAILHAPNDSHILYSVGKILLSMGEDVDSALQLIEFSSHNEIKAAYFLGKYYFENKDKNQGFIRKAEEFLSKAAARKIKDSQRLYDMCTIELKKLKNHPYYKLPNTQPDNFNSNKNKNGKKLIAISSDNLFSIDTILELQKLDIQKSDIPKVKPEQQKAPVVENKTIKDVFIDLSLSNEKLIQKGEEFQALKIYKDAFQCFEAVAKRGDAYGYFKCAEVCQDLETKLQYYQYAILNNIKGAFRGWRKCIFDHANSSRNKNLIPYLAKKFEDHEDFSDATILYQKAKDTENSERCFKKAIQNISNIKDGMQQFEFGNFLEQRQEIELAFDMFEKAAENGVTSAIKKRKDLAKIKMSQLKRLNETEFYLEQGICYFKGKDGTQIDYSKAFQNFTNASDIGCPKADYYLGCYYQKFGELNQAIFYYQKSANSGDSDGQNSYGDCFMFGIGVQKDIKEAIKYYKLAAEQGNMIAEYNYGREIYLNPHSENQKNEGIDYLRKAAEKQFPDAMYLYSKAIKNKNQIESRKYFNMSIEKGSELAIKQYGKELEENDQLDQAAKLYKSAANRGLLTGYVKYAECITNGNALDGDDIDLARDLMKKAADFGEAKDQFNYVTFLTQYSYQDSASMKEKAYYSKKASEQGYVKAYFPYAECLENGQGIEVDIDMARKYYTLSYQQDPQSLTRCILQRLINQNLIDTSIISLSG